MAPAIQYTNDENWSIRLYIGAWRWRNRIITAGVGLLIAAGCAWLVMTALGQDDPSALQLAVPGSVAVTFAILSVFVLCSTRRVRNTDPITDASKDELLAVLKRFTSETFGASPSELQRHRSAAIAVQQIARGLNVLDEVAVDVAKGESLPQIVETLRSKAAIQASKCVVDGRRSFEVAVPVQPS